MSVCELLLTDQLGDSSITADENERNVCYALQAHPQLQLESQGPYHVAEVAVSAHVLAAPYALCRQDWLAAGWRLLMRHWYRDSIPVALWTQSGFSSRDSGNLFERKETYYDWFAQEPAGTNPKLTNTNQHHRLPFPAPPTEQDRR
jgi:hypothetical protein